MRPAVRFASSILVLATLVATAAPAAGRSPMALGISQEQGSRDPNAVRAFASRAGRMPASWTIWSNWGNPALEALPDEHGKVAHRHGRHPDGLVAARSRRSGAVPSRGTG